MPTGYTAFREVAIEKPEWLPVISVCYEMAGETVDFAGVWVLIRLGHWIPSLRSITSSGILKKVGTSRSGRRAYYRMPNRQNIGLLHGFTELSFIILLAGGQFLRRAPRLTSPTVIRDVELGQ